MWHQVFWWLLSSGQGWSSFLPLGSGSTPLPNSALNPAGRGTRNSPRRTPLYTLNRHSSKLIISRTRWRQEVGHVLNYEVRILEQNCPHGRIPWCMAWQSLL